MDNKERDWLGRIVRMVWIQWAKEQPNPKESWLIPYDELDETSKEADRRIGEVVYRVLKVDQLIHENKKLLKSLERMAAENQELREKINERR